MDITYVVVWQDNNAFAFETKEDAIAQMEELVDEWQEEDDHSCGGIDVDGNSVYLIEAENC